MKKDKWYLCECYEKKTKYILKFTKECTPYTDCEWIYEKEYSSSGGFDTINILREVNIQEIAHILPEWHVDKLKLLDYELY